jgi:hypothetical protein
MPAWKEQCDEGNCCTGKTVRRRTGHCAKIGGEGEEWSRHGLSQPVTCQKRLVADPSRRDDLGLKQRQHDMAAAKDQRTRSVERVEQRERLRAGHAHDDRRNQEKCGE